MVDRVTANLPSRDFSETEAFYAPLGFARVFRNEGWMILRREGAKGPLELEFFAHPGLDPAESWFSACIRVDDPDSLLAEWQAAGVDQTPGAIPRLTGMFKLEETPRMFALIDRDGSLLRVLDNLDRVDVEPVAAEGMAP